MPEEGTNWLKVAGWIFTIGVGSIGWWMLLRHARREITEEFKGKSAGLGVSEK